MWLMVSIGLLTIVAIYSTYLELSGLAKLHLFRYDYAFFFYAFHTVLTGNAGTKLYSMPNQVAWLQAHHFPLNPNNQYVYPPQFAVFWSPLGHLPFALSFDIWFGFTVAAYGVAIALLARMMWPRVGIVRWIFVALFAVLLTPFQIDAGAGNVNSILFALIVLTFYLRYQKHRKVLAGIPLGLAIVFKVTPGAILVYLLLRREWRTSMTTMITVVVLTVITGMATGWMAIWSYLTHFVSFGHTSMKNGPAPYNQSLIGVEQLFIRHHLVHLTSRGVQIEFLVCSVLIAIIVYSIARRHHLDWRIHMAMASLTPLLFSPLVEEMHMVFVLPTLFVTCAWMETSYMLRRRIRASTVSLAVVTTVGIFSLVLPLTFAVNAMTSWWPGLYWLHAQMFVVLIFAMTGITCLGWSPQRMMTSPAEARSSREQVDFSHSL